jgi:hypothetical protein
MAKRRAGSRTAKPKAPVFERSLSGPRCMDVGPPMTGTLTVRVPLALGRRGGRKVILTPSDGSAWAPKSTRFDDSLVKAIARAFRWRELLESGTYATVAEIADAEKINASYVGRVLRLTLLAPDIVEAILGGRQPAGLQLKLLLRRFPAGWGKQREDIFGTGNCTGHLR